MKTKALDFNRWDDIVFENRNKDYGAYVLRKTYNDKLIGAMFASTACLMAILLFFALSGVKKVIPPLKPETIREFFIQPPPVIPKPPVRMDTPPPVRTYNSNLPPLVTTDPVDEQPVTDTEISEPVVDGETGGTVYTGEPVTTTLPAEVPVRTVINFAQVMPEYENGTEGMMKFIKKKLKYPPSIRRQNLGGIVYVQFVVNGDGTVSDVQVLRGFHPDADKEAARVIAMLPGWKGGRQNDMPVNVRMVLPIHFRMLEN